MLRLFQGEQTGHFSKHAGKKTRCAIVFLEFLNRRPRRVIKTEFSILYFDRDGGLDPEVQSQQLRLIGESIEADPRLGVNVVDIRPRIAQKVYRQKFEWTPTEDELETIIRKCL
jgi:hypothetical protein